MKRKKLMIIAMIMMCLVTGGCGMNNKDDATNVTLVSGDKVDKQVTLNERQKSILKEEGLSENYEDLTTEQQVSIVRMEELFQILEDKYDVQFSYLGYKRAEILEGEQLIAYPTGGSKDDVVTLKYYKGEWHDDYDCVAVRPYYEKATLRSLENIYAAGNVKTQATVSWVKTQIDTKSIDFERIKEDVAASSLVIINDKDISPEQYEAQQDRILAELRREGLDGSFYVILLNEKEYARANDWDYMDLTDKQVDYEFNINTGMVE